MTAEVTTDRHGWPVEQCGQCDGSGVYVNYNRRCHGCNGSGWRYTSSAKAARKYVAEQLRQLRHTPIEAVSTGDRLVVTSGKSKVIATVAEVELESGDDLGGSVSVAADGTVTRRVFTAKYTLVFEPVVVSGQLRDIVPVTFHDGASVQRVNDADAEAHVIAHARQMAVAK